MESQKAVQPKQMDKPVTVHHGINWKFEFQQYSSALMVAIPIYAAFSIYNYYRWGYYSLYIANKAFSDMAIVILSLAVLLGPLSRFFNIFDRYVQYRKELGIIAVCIIFIHLLFSVFFLPQHFPLTVFTTTGLWPFLFGFGSFVILLIVLAISNQYAQHALGGKLWWKVQNWGLRFGFLFALIHIIWKKSPGWIAWYRYAAGGDTMRWWLPDAGLLVAWFAVGVLAVRIAEIAGIRAGKAAWFVFLVLLPLVYLATFMVNRNLL